jgi:hypothetical protein
MVPLYPPLFFGWTISLNAKEIFLLECEYSKLYLRAEDEELRMELRLPALQQKVFITKNK